VEDGRTGLQTLVDGSVAEVFSFEIDTYWIQHGGGNPVSWLSSLAGRMPLVHVKDMAMRGSEQLFAEVGEGNLEWSGILDACRDGGVEWYLVEQDICQGDPFDALGVSLRNLRGMGLH
jgi:sugar phosphate isomerase/epimerase